MLRKELLNESMTHILLFQLFSMVHWDWRVSVLLNYQLLHSHVILCAVMLIWIAEMKCTRVYLCVHICVLCPQGPAVLGYWCKQFWLVKGCWEALIQFQQHVLLHQLDNEGYQCRCTSEITPISSNLYSFKSTASSFNDNWYVKTIL